MYYYLGTEEKNALTIAFENKNRPLVDILISSGAKFNCEHGYRLFYEQCKKGEMGDFKLLIDNGAFNHTFCCKSDGMTNLMEVARNGFIEKVRLILTGIPSAHKTMYINEQNKLGFNALHYACMNNHQEVVKLLIQHGASVNFSTSKFKN
jgi:ankyrin repeat protein